MGSREVDNQPYCNNDEKNPLCSLTNDRSTVILEWDSYCTGGLRVTVGLVWPILLGIIPPIAIVVFFLG